MRISVICTLLQRKYYLKMMVKVLCIITVSLTLMSFLAFYSVSNHLNINRDEIKESISNLDHISPEYQEMILENYELLYSSCFRIASGFFILYTVEIVFMSLLSEFPNLEPMHDVLPIFIGATFIIVIIELISMIYF